MCSNGVFNRSFGSRKRCFSAKTGLHVIRIIHFNARPIRRAEVNGGVQRFEAEVERRQPRGEIQGDAGMRVQEIRQSRCKPARAQGGQDREVQRSAAWIGAEGEGGAGDPIQRLTDLAGIDTAGE